MRKLLPLFILPLVISCGESSSDNNTPVPLPAAPGANSAPANRTADQMRTTELDSSARGYLVDNYNLIDTFSAGNNERKFNSEKSFIRTSFAFNEEKIFYNTGVRTEKYTAVVAGFNTGHYQLENAPMDGLVVRAVPRNGYWFIQANTANGTIHERMTVDVLFIRNDQAETVLP